MNPANLAINWAEQGRLPDHLLRAGIRRLLRQRLTEIHAGDSARAAALTEQFAATLHSAPLALVPEKANAQHYEVPRPSLPLYSAPIANTVVAYGPKA